MRTIRSLVVAGAAGAAMYFFDPDRGVARRAEAKQRLDGRLKTGAADAGSRPSPVAAGGGTVGLSDDQALEDRIKTELGARWPKGQVVIDVIESRAELRGQLVSQQEIEDLVLAVGRVKGVGGVTNLVHLPGTMPPDKDAAPGV